MDISIWVSGTRDFVSTHVATELFEHLSVVTLGVVQLLIVLVLMVLYARQPMSAWLPPSLSFFYCVAETQQSFNLRVIVL